MKMSSIIRELIGAGVTGDALVAAIERIEADEQETVSVGAMRQRRYRERQASRVTSQASQASLSVTGDAGIYIEDSSLLINEEGSKKESKKTHTARVTPSRNVTPVTPQKSRKTSCPPEFQPNPTTIAHCKSLGWTDDAIPAEIQHFVDDAKAHDRRYADWQAACRKWFSSPYQRGPASGERPSNSGTNSAARPAQSHSDAILSGMGRVAARLSEERRAAAGESFGDRAPEFEITDRGPTKRAAAGGAIIDLDLRRDPGWR